MPNNDQSSVHATETTTAGKGLSTTEVGARLEKFGPNDVEEQRSSVIKKFLAPLYSPIALMLLAAAALSWWSGKSFDAYFILALYLANYSVQKWQEFKADKAISDLRGKLSFDVSTLRDGQWTSVNARNLVPGDCIRLGLGSIIPADGELVAANNLTVNEAVLTGESLPKDKKIGDTVYSGAFINSGNLQAEVTATGKNTSFGKTIFSIEPSTEKSLLEKDILSITRFLTFISLTAVALMTIVFLIKGAELTDLLTLDLSLVIAGIPVALPAVMAIILSIGAAGLAKKQVIVRRLSALQDLANVNMLLTDKTGTLTKNEIRVTNVISYRHELSTDDVVELAGFTVNNETPSIMDTAILRKLEEYKHHPNLASRIKFTPFDSDRKRSTALIKQGKTETLISLGAPQLIQKLAEFPTNEPKEKFETDVKNAAGDGFRVLAVATKKDTDEEKNMEIAGLILLADPLDSSSKTTIGFMRENGIDVKIVTGDNRSITERIVGELKMNGRVVPVEEARKFYHNRSWLKEKAPQIAAFAEVLPEDKYRLVTEFKRRYIVAATGDGINDLPALKAANVGIAVAGGVSALKSMADIVLLGQGLAVIQDAIIESRKIFVRLYNYSLYRISESFRLIITILVLGIGYGFYPLQPLQIIILVFMNDIPIISLAVDRVKIAAKPSEIHPKERFGLSLLFGTAGILNSLILFFIMMHWWRLPMETIQTIFFLKLAVSGHMLIFVAHTKERWYKFLPAKGVIYATLGTQAVSTLLAVTGWLMPAKISIGYALLVWLWAFLWMQISELMKDVQKEFMK